MSHRSAVTACIVGPENTMRAHLVSFRLTHVDAQKTFGQFYFYVRDEQLFATIHLIDVKWYSGAEEVEAFSALFNFLREEEFNGINGAFVRLGEDDADIETIYFGDNPYDLVSVHRSISFAEKFDESNCGNIPS